MTVHIILGEFDDDTTTVLEVQENGKVAIELVKHFQSQGCYSKVWAEKWEVWGGNNVNTISSTC